MDIYNAIVYIFLLINITECTLSPPTTKNKKEKNKIEVKKGPVDLDVFTRKLVVQDPKPVDILKESGLYCKNTKKRNFTGQVLGYITPWNSEGLEVAKIFHGKLTIVSPVWLTLPRGNVKKFQLATHDVQKKWLDHIRASNHDSHNVRILPRVLFEEWKSEDISALQTNDQRKSQLVTTLAETAKTFKFNGYVLEIWNQFVYTGVKIGTVVSLIESLAKKLKEKNLEVILAIPPARGPEAQMFSQAHFERLAPYVEYFSLMTYDFSSLQRPGPNSPIHWARECVEKLVPDDDDPRRTQILMGLNFYGNNYTPEGGGPIVGSQYLKILESFKGKFQWDERSREHFFEVKTVGGSEYVFYPTLYSLQHRIDLAKELNTGLSIWELGQGLNFFYDLF